MRESEQRQTLQVRVTSDTQKSYSLVGHNEAVRKDIT